MNKTEIMWNYLFGNAEVKTEYRPVPVRWCRNKTTGEIINIDAVSQRELTEKIMEEAVEAIVAETTFTTMTDARLGDQREKVRHEMGLEWTDAKFAIETKLSRLGFTAAEREELCREVYEKNKARGYYE